MNLNKLCIVLKVLSYRKPVHNLTSFLRKRGSFLLPNSYELEYNPNNYKSIRLLFLYSVIYGVIFSRDDGYWHYNDNIITTPNAIRFSIFGFHPLIFAETFLNDIHFLDYDYAEKTVIQAGAFVGDTALYYASKGAKVYSFEPSKANFVLALRNLELNPELSGNIVLENCALGKDETVEFPLDEGNHGDSSIYLTKKSEVMKVQSFSLKSILETYNINSPNILDLDVKGKEFDLVNQKELSEFQIVRIEYLTEVGGKKIGYRKFFDR